MYFPTVSPIMTPCCWCTGSARHLVCGYALERLHRALSSEYLHDDLHFLELIIAVPYCLDRRSIYTGFKYTAQNRRIFWMYFLSFGWRTFRPGTYSDFGRSLYM